ncbi:MAG: hypothetical protein H2040_11760 [Euryhalocaulis sp.]|uniref:hypothetical protein n=1 Tax=Euryhalocaulis sp. TaxID=2744307 RepID=UPI0017E89A9B|nr:hypothetical protein [Euryhalocaulis sp.]MBA4802525.1 hypothetical protein [Euryhalocaulis sp.]
MPHPDDVHRCTIEIYMLDNDQWRAVVEVIERAGPGNRHTAFQDIFATHALAKEAAEKCAKDFGFSASQLRWIDDKAMGKKS